MTVNFVLIIIAWEYMVVYPPTAKDIGRKRYPGAIIDPINPTVIDASRKGIVTLQAGQVYTCKK